MKTLICFAIVFLSGSVLSQLEPLIAIDPIPIRPFPIPQPKPLPTLVPKPNLNTPYQYQIVSPAYALPGERFTVIVQVAKGLEKYSRDENGRQIDPLPLTVTLDVINGNVTLIETLTRIIDEWQSITFSIKLPETISAGSHQIQVQVTSQQGITETFFAVLKVRAYNRIILIQTDKPVYKPGQLVLGRVIVLNPDLTSASGTVGIEIKNSKNSLVASYKNNTLTGGINRFKFALSFEPVLGDYQVCATHEGGIQKQDKCFTFKVEEYVLPKFSCSITPKKDQLPCFGLNWRDRNIRRKICYTVSATYTYGQKVKGAISATASFDSRRRSCDNSETIIQDEIDGVTTVCVDVCASRYHCYGNIALEANVTDPTGEEISCEGTKLIPIRSSPYQIEIKKIQNEAFYPCQTTQYKVKTTLVTGKPYEGAIVNLTCNALLKNKKVCGPDAKQIYTAVKTTGQNGQALFDFCAPCNALEITCTAQAVNETNYVPRGYSRRVLIYSKEHAKIQKPTRQLRVGTVARFNAFLSKARVAKIFVMSRGIILETLTCKPREIPSQFAMDPDVCENPFQYTCAFRFRVTSLMLSKVTIVLTQKDLSADLISLPVASDPRKQLSLRFSSAQVEPGENVNLRIRAAEGSSVGVVAVDQSVYLQQAKNQLTFSQVGDEASRFDSSLDNLPRSEFKCGASNHWSCYCEKFGCREDEKEERSPLGPREDSPKRIIPLPIYCPEAKCHRSVCRLVRNCQYVSAFSFLKAAGLNVVSNFNSGKDSSPSCAVPKPPKGYPCCVIYRKFSLVQSSRQGPAPVPELAGPPGSKITADDETEVDSSGSDTELVEVKKERTNFPETWIWTEIQLEQNVNEYTLALTAPDSITSWVADGFALSAQNAISIARPTSLRVFQPFFVSLTLPYSVIRGEKVEIRCTVFNYLDTALTVFVELEVDSNEINIIESKSDKTKDSRRQVKVPAGEARSIDYFLATLKIGYLSMKCTARSTQAADAVVQSLLVEPEGVEKEYSRSSLICLEDSESDCIEKSFSLTLPSNYIPDSESATVKVTADYMGPTIEGLENLLRLPYGCGEQNMINFAPGVYITRYLTAIGKLDEKTEEKALEIMNTGYQRELTFQRDDGSYSAFGNRDKCGSMWLTAFVVRSFSQANGIINIDSGVQKEAIEWMKKKQSRDGSFPSVCRVIHKEMQGCSGGECSLTAYVTLALLEAGVSPNDPQIVDALDFLSSKCVPTNCENNYALSLVSLIFCKAGDSRANTFISKLRDCASTQSDTTYWKYSLESTSHCYESRWGGPCAGRSCDVETTAYALLAFTCSGDVGYSLNIVRWLMEQRNPSGGFRSTQDTVVALQALSEYAALTISSNNVNLRVELSSGKTLRVDASNSQAVQVASVASLPTTLTARACGIGCVLVQVGVKYNIPEPPEDAAFEVTAVATMEETKGKSCSYQIEVCNRWLLQEPNSSNMALTDITLFSGFSPIDSDLAELQKKQVCQIKRIDKQDRRVRVYLDEVTQEKCCFTLRMKRTVLVEELKGVPVLTYNYYDPDQSGGTMVYPREECK